MSICYIDILDRCNLRCPTCIRGARLLPNSAKLMSIDDFKKTIEKLKHEGYMHIAIFNWTEPFLVQTLPDYIAVVKAAGLRCEISSNLSLEPDKFADTIRLSLLAGVNHLFVSVSGFSQEVYQINHVGGTISWVKENLERISTLKRAGAITTDVILKFIRFDYNLAEETPLRDFAQSLGVGFEAITGSGRPDTPVSSFAHEEYYLDLIKNYAPSREIEKTGDICPLLMDTLSIDCDGYAYTCCAYPNYPSLRIGLYLELSREDLLFKRYVHPICASCTLPRRKATEDDCEAMVRTIKSRLGFS